MARLDGSKLLKLCPTDLQKSTKTKKRAIKRMEFEGVMLRKEIKLDLAEVQSETPQRLLQLLALSRNHLVQHVCPLAAFFSKSAEMELMSTGHCRQGSNAELQNIQAMRHQNVR